MTAELKHCDDRPTAQEGNLLTTTTRFTVPKINPGNRSWRHVRPVASHPRVEHGPDAPAGAEDVERLGEAVVVDDPRVHGEEAHEQDDVAAAKQHVEHLPQSHQSQKSSTKRWRAVKQRDHAESGGVGEEGGAA